MSERTLQAVTNDIAQAIQEGSAEDSLVTDGVTTRFVTEVQEYNTITVMDDDGKEYLITIEEV
jgi:hypothetical protein